MIMMILRLIGTHPEKPEIIVEFYEDNLMLLYLKGTKPFFRKSLSVEEVKEILLNAGYSITEEVYKNE